MNEMKKGSRPRHQKKKKTADPDLCSFYEQSSPLQLFFPEYVSVSNWRLVLFRANTATYFSSLPYLYLEI